MNPHAKQSDTSSSGTKSTNDCYGVGVKKIRHLINRGMRFVFDRDPRILLAIGLTYRCQCNCRHCGMALYKRAREKELSTREVLGLIKGLSRRKIKGVYFFGGEPLLRKDILELISQASQRKLYTVLDTNGYLLNQAMAKNLKRAGLDSIEVSIDSPYPEVHNQLRKKEGVFERAVKGIKFCLNEKIRCLISTYATKENLKNGDLKKVISLGEKLGVSRIRILPPILSGKWLCSEEINLDYQARQILDSLRRSSFVHLEDGSCKSMRKRLIYISPYGEVQPCPYVPFYFGNIRTEPLEKILIKLWESPIFKTKKKNCPNCPMNNEEFRKKYIAKITPLTKLPIDLS